jgi:hypothetical protein
MRASAQLYLLCGADLIGAAGVTARTLAGATFTLGFDGLYRLTSKSSSGAGCGSQVNTSYRSDMGFRLLPSRRFRATSETPLQPEKVGRKDG